MEFAERLHIILNLYSVSNAVLARALGVDPSLVSRWRSGVRSPAKNSGASLAIGRFLSSLTLPPLGQKQLEHLLGISVENAQDTAGAISAWLMAGCPAADNDDETADEPENIIGLLSSSGGAPYAPANLWPLVSRGKTFEHEVFFGYSGKRQAAVNFLHAVLSSRNPTDVYMMDFDGDEWLDEDPLIKTQWERAMVSLSAQGHSLYIIRSETNGAELSRLLSRYLPLFRAGGSLYSCAGSDFVACVLAARDVAAAVSHNSSQTPDARQTVLYSNATDALIYEDVVKSHLASSRELFSVYPENRLTAFAGRIVELTAKKVPFTALRLGLNPLWLPEGRLYALLLSAPADQAKRLLHLFSRMRANFESAMAEGVPWTEVLPAGLLDPAAAEKGLTLSGSELFIGRDVSLSPADTALCLYNLREFIIRYPSFLPVFSEKIAGGPGVILSREREACLYGTSDGGRYGFTTCDPGLIKGFSALLSDAAGSALSTSREAALESVERALSRFAL